MVLVFAFVVLGCYNTILFHFIFTFFFLFTLYRYSFGECFLLMLVSL